MSLDLYSEDSIEDLFREIDIERQKQTRDVLQNVIDELEISGGAQTSYQYLSEPSLEEHVSPNDEVFEIDFENIANKEKDSRTTSIDVNVYRDDQSRSNSLEYLVPMPQSRRVSLDDQEFRRVTRSRSTFTRVPLESTPLKNAETDTMKDSFTPPGSPSF